MEILIIILIILLIVLFMAFMFIFNEQKNEIKRLRNDISYIAVNKPNYRIGQVLPRFENDQNEWTVTDIAYIRTSYLIGGYYQYELTNLKTGKKQ